MSSVYIKSISQSPDRKSTLQKLDLKTSISKGTSMMKLNKNEGSG